jgi:hypothetical protein
LTVISKLFERSFSMKRICMWHLGLIAMLLCSVGALAQELPPLPPPPPDAEGPVVFKYQRMVGGKVVAGAPYSATSTVQSTQTLSDGTHINRTNTVTLYRDSQGRTRREETMDGFGPWSAPQDESKQMVFINDPVAGTHYVLDPSNKTAHKMPAPPPPPGSPATAAAPGEPAPPPAVNFSSEAGAGFAVSVRGGSGNVMFKKEPGTVATEQLGTQMISGVSAEGTRETRTIPAGAIGNDQQIQVVSERWYSPDLQIVLMSKRSDPRSGTTTYQLSNVNRNEPAAALFQVPSDYTLTEGPAHHVRHRMGMAPKQ